MYNSVVITYNSYTFAGGRKSDEAKQKKEKEKEKSFFCCSSAAEPCFLSLETKIAWTLEEVVSFGAFVLFVKSSESFHLNYKLGKKKRWKWETCSPHHCTFQVFPIAFILLLLSIKRKKTIKLVCLYWRHLSFSILPIRQVFRCPVNQRLETVWVFFFSTSPSLLAYDSR